VSDPTGHLRTLARRVADSCVGQTQPRAILLVGSAATGEADVYSDLGMGVYYDNAPSAEALAEMQHVLGAERYRGTPWSDESGEPDEGGYSERYSKLSGLRG
jgi:predicted nucleotidyltransferase